MMDTTNKSAATEKEKDIGTERNWEAELEKEQHVANCYKNTGKARYGTNQGWQIQECTSANVTPTSSHETHHLYIRARQNHRNRATNVCHYGGRPSDNE